MIVFWWRNFDEGLSIKKLKLNTLMNDFHWTTRTKTFIANECIFIANECIFLQVIVLSSLIHWLPAFNECIFIKNSLITYIQWMYFHYWFIDYLLAAAAAAAATAAALEAAAAAATAAAAEGDPADDPEDPYWKN